MDLRTQRKLDNYIGRIGIALLRPPARLLGAILRRDHQLSVGKEIVWIKLLGGGSLLLAMPMLLGFRHAHPGTRMVLVTTRAVKPFAELLGVFDEYRIIDQRGVRRLIGSAVAVWWRTLGADCIVDLEVHSRLTTVFTTLTLARNRVSFWLEDIFWRQGLASHLVFYNRSSGSYHFYDRVGDLFGVPVASHEECRNALARSAPAVAATVPHQVAIGFACSDLGQERMLNPAQWVRAFRDNLSNDQKSFLFLGGPGDRAAGDAIIAELHRAIPGLDLRNACGELSLPESVGVLLTSREFWGIDSSLLHLARIAGLRCVSYWGPTDPSTRLRTTWTIDETMHYRKIACSPCVHTSEEPPCQGDNRCIQGLLDGAAAAPPGWTPIAYPLTRRSATA
jgi:ADP-heptose:LPS heptosyltransferase